MILFGDSQTSSVSVERQTGRILDKKAPERLIKFNYGPLNTKGKIMIAKDRADETAVFTHCGTSGTVPLKKYGLSGTFGFVVAEKLATTELTETEYAQIVQEMGKIKRIPLKAYIQYCTKKGFDIVSKYGRYQQK